MILAVGGSLSIGSCCSLRQNSWYSRMDILASTAATIVHNCNDDDDFTDERESESLLDNGEPKIYDNHQQRGRWTEEEVKNETTLIPDINFLAYILLGSNFKRCRGGAWREKLEENIRIFTRTDRRAMPSQMAKSP